MCVSVAPCVCVCVCVYVCAYVCVCVCVCEENGLEAYFASYEFSYAARLSVVGFVVAVV